MNKNNKKKLFLIFVQSGVTQNMHIFDIAPLVFTFIFSVKLLPVLTRGFRKNKDKLYSLLHYLNHRIQYNLLSHKELLR